MGGGAKVCDELKQIRQDLALLDAYLETLRSDINRIEARTLSISHGLDTSLGQFAADYILFKKTTRAQ